MGMPDYEYKKSPAVRRATYGGNTCMIILSQECARIMEEIWKDVES